MLGFFYVLHSQFFSLLSFHDALDIAFAKITTTKTAKTKKSTNKCVLFEVLCFLYHFRHCYPYTYILCIVENKFIVCFIKFDRKMYFHTIYYSRDVLFA